MNMEQGIGSSGRGAGGRGLRRRLVVSLVTGIGALFGSAQAQPVPDYDFDWVTVGDPGNRPTRPEEIPALPNARIGSVDHIYRLSRTNLSNLQMLEFVRAYAPFWQGDPDSEWLTGDFIYGVRQPGGSYEYHIEQGGEHWATYIGWEIAARYCNWLHNGKVNEPWAFENGAYDTSTFTENDDGSFNHQRAHNPDARFWIPTLDELIKGAYWDPHKDGVGGYYMHPGRSDDPLVEGLPEDGGQTIGALVWDLGGEWGTWDLEQYPHTRSPWGLLDVSATEQQWTETPRLWGPNMLNSQREVVGSVAGELLWSCFDRLDLRIAHFVWDAAGGTLRVASVVPNGCVPDLTGDGILDMSDVQGFLNAFAASEEFTDWNDDGAFNFFDVQAFLASFAAGCP